MTLTRRQAMLAVMALPLAGDAHAATPGHLTIPLDRWATIAVEYRGRRVEFTTAEIFTILEGR